MVALICENEEINLNWIQNGKGGMFTVSNISENYVNNQNGNGNLALNGKLALNGNSINININNHFPTPIKHRKLDKENIIKEVVDDRCNDRQRKLDKIFTSKVTGIPIMFLLLAMVLYITIIGANYPSDFLSYIFAKGGEYLYEFLNYISLPSYIISLICF